MLLLLRVLLPGLAAFWVMQSAAMAQGVAATTGFAQVNQTSLRYQLAGTGPRTIVLLHELGMSLESWDDIVSELSRSHRVLRYDLRGFGLSEKLRGAVTIEDEVDDLRGLLDTLGMTEPVTLVGGALGGAIALRFAAAEPQRVAAVMALSRRATSLQRVDRRIWPGLRDSNALEYARMSMPPGRTPIRRRCEPGMTTALRACWPCSTPTTRPAWRRHCG